MDYEKAIEQASAVSSFMKKHESAFENKYGLVEFGRYFQYFRDMEGLYTTPIRIPYNYKDTIIAKYKDKIVCSKPYPDPTPIMSTLIQESLGCHYIFDSNLMFVDEQQDKTSPFVSVRVFSNNLVKDTNIFVKKNMKNIVKLPSGQSGFGFKNPN